MKDQFSGKIRRAYQIQKWRAKNRNIAFLFTIEEWWDWWQIDDRWSNRGRGRGKFCMARFNDTGPYHPDNVYCATHTQNMRDVRPDVRERTAAARREPNPKSHLAVRGECHPRSRRVVTPLGKFGSAALAADRHGITRQHAAKLARSGANGWTYD